MLPINASVLVKRNVSQLEARLHKGPIRVVVFIRTGLPEKGM